MRLRAYAVFILLLWLSSCIDPFKPVINGDAGGQLVIEGAITDQPGQHRVYLSRARSVNDPNTRIPDMVSGAKVEISDDAGNVFVLTEINHGIYVTQLDVKGIVGRFYQLRVVYQEREYLSDPELLTASSEPAAIEAEFAREYIKEGSGQVEKDVVLFYLDLHNSPGTTDFYKYDVDFTYEIETPYWQTPYECGDPEAVELTPNVCYVSEQPDAYLNIISLSGYSGSLFQQHFLTAIDPNRRFMRKFSIHVSQYSMTERAYDYWNNIQEQGLRTGSLFDPPPSRIPGNLQSVSEPDEQVLGYFMASSVKKRRGFFSPEVLEAEPENFNGCDCFPEPTIKCMGVVPPDGFVLPPPRNYCCDCREYPNATAEKPLFWTD